MRSDVARRGRLRPSAVRKEGNAREPFTLNAQTLGLPPAVSSNNKDIVSGENLFLPPPPSLSSMYDHA